MTKSMTRQGKPNEKEGPPERPLALPCLAVPSLVLYKEQIQWPVKSLNRIFSGRPRSTPLAELTMTTPSMQSSPPGIDSRQAWPISSGYDEQASRLRAAFVAEVAALYSDCEAA
jgi:hypothetical protein